MKNSIFIFSLSFILFFSLTGYSNGKPHSILTQDLPPWSYAAEKGIIVDIVNEIERRIGTKIKINSLPWSRAQQMTKTGDSYLIFPLARVPKREKNFVWVIDVMASDLVFASLHGKSITLDMAKKLNKILVQQDTPPEFFLRANNFQNIHTITNSAKIPVMLQKNRADAWFGDMNVTISTFLNTSYGKKMVYGPSVKNNRIYIGASKNISPILVKKYQKIFNEIKKDGTYKMIMDRYLKSSE
ncbi:MAG: transporter substrate-binding domain-containing protein [Desulfobacula sp.]|nr:transporter substrate-binding domain-containing protein [Desulfobacula sp.]